METEEAVNKTHIVIETGVTIYDEGHENISDNVIIATLAAVAFALFTAISIVVWRCFMSSDNSNSQEHSLLRSPIYTPETVSVPRNELTRLLHKYSHVHDDGSVESDQAPHLSWSKQDLSERSCAEAAGNIALPSESFMSYSPWQLTPERLRKSSGSPVPHRLSSSDRMNASLVGDKSSMSYHNESLLPDEPIFTSSPGHYPNKRLWKVTNLNEYRPASASRSPGQRSRASDTGSQANSRYKSFYFAWPEEQDDEDPHTVWSPLLMQLEMSRQESSSSLHCSLANRIRAGSFDSTSSKIVNDGDKGVVKSRSSIGSLAGVKNTWV